MAGACKSAGLLAPAPCPIGFVCCPGQCETSHGFLEMGPRCCALAGAGFQGECGPLGRLPLLSQMSFRSLRADSVEVVLGSKARHALTSSQKRFRCRASSRCAFLGRSRPAFSTKVTPLSWSSTWRRSHFGSLVSQPDRKLTRTKSSNCFRYGSSHGGNRRPFAAANERSRRPAGALRLCTLKVESGLDRSHPRGGVDAQHTG